MNTGRLFIVPVINCMGPVTDPRHSDLLNSWDDVDRCMSKVLEEKYRERYLDSAGKGAVFNFFFISWSGFKTNPVHRDFGYFNVFDHYRNMFGAKMEAYGDGFYWMYNHPDESGVGNVWGLEWLQNTHYWNILNRLIIERGYFPAVAYVPTEKNDTSHWLEDWFPFGVGNRNCSELNLMAKQPGGQISGEVIDWQSAPDDWGEYHPSYESYQKAGNMKRTIFRMLDVKSILYELSPAEIEKGFKRCLTGKNTAILAFEHDFRDRAETIMERLIEPAHRLGKMYPNVRWEFANVVNAARGVLGYADISRPEFSLSRFGDSLRIRSSEPLFGPEPYVAVKDLASENSQHVPAARIGENIWEIKNAQVSPSCVIGIAANDPFGNVGVKRYSIQDDRIVESGP